MKKNKLDRSKLVKIDKKHDSPKEVIEKSIRNIIVALGDNPDRPGLLETPSRVERAYQEIFEGMKYTNHEIAEMFDKCFEEVNSKDLVVIGDIEVFSMCEHHILPMYDMKVHIGYIPNGKVIGLSKAGRVANMAAKRLQLQERLGIDIADIMSEILDTDDIIVVIEGKHACMTMRGIKNTSSVTRTATMRGSFDTDHQLRSEFYSLIK